MPEENRMAYLSPSKIQSLMKCPMAFYFDYVLKVPRKSSGTFHYGLVIHSVIEKALKQVILGGKLPSWEDATDWGAEDWASRAAKEESKESFIGWQWNEGDSPEKARSEVDPLVKFTIQEVLPKIRPLYAEHRWNKEYADDKGGKFRVYGVIDALEQDWSVIDWKTADGEVSKFARKHDAQVDAYGVWTSEYSKKDVIDFRKIFLVRRGTHPFADVEKYQVTVRHRERFEELAKNAWKLIQGGGYVPNNSGWWCSKKFCSHWEDVCPHGGALLKEEF